MLPRSGIKIARIMGIEVRINISWLIIFVLVGFSLGETFRTDVSGITRIGTRTFPGGPWPWLLGFLTAAIFFACLLAHEVSHSVVAKRNGLPISRITLFIFGGVAEMGEDVSDAKTELKMAIAGPLLTLILGGIFYGLYVVARSAGANPALVAPLFYLGSLNLFVGVFNLLPGFPLDGGRVLRAIIWRVTGDLKRSTRAASVGGQVIAGLMAVVGVYLLFGPRLALSGIWLIIIAAFLFQLSRASYQQTLFRLAAENAKVSDIMYTEVPVVQAGTSLDELRNKYFSGYHLPVFPVAENGHLIGLVDREDLYAVSRSEWSVLNTGRIARPLEAGQVISPDTPLDKVMRMLLSREEYVLVAEGNDVKGILTRDELMRYINARMKIIDRR